MALTLVRHTRPHSEGLCYGRAEILLADSFTAEAEALAATLTPARLVSSPLDRCQRLARYLAARLAVPMTLDDRLAEIDFGAWEGRPWTAIPRPELDAWATDLLHARPHGGESVAMLLARTRAVLADLRATGAPCIAVTHAGVIRAALVAGGDPSAWQRPIPYAEPIVLPG